MFPIQPRCRGQRDEKLAAIGIGPAIRHTQDPSTGMLETRVDLVLEFFAIDACAAAAGAGGVAGLDHEVRDDAVGEDVVIVAALGESGEVLTGLGVVSSDVCPCLV